LKRERRKSTKVLKEKEKGEAEKKKTGPGSRRPGCWPGLGA